VTSYRITLRDRETKTVVGYYNGCWTTDRRRAVILRKREVAEAHAARMRDRTPRNADVIKVEEINASIEWSRDRGFCATLGNPRVAENWFHSSGQAVSWLKHEAPVHYPETEFIHALDQIALRIDTILDDLQANKISGSISWVWDGGFRVTLGDRKRDEAWTFPTIGEAAAWLRNQACARYPDSNFARKYGGFV
jgi:hypothetical protein